MNLNTFQQNVMVVAMIVFLLGAELTAMVLYVYDTIHNIPVPVATTNFITMGFTYVISFLSHQQGSKSSQNGVQQGIESQNKTAPLQ